MPRHLALALVICAACGAPTAAAPSADPSIDAPTPLPMPAPTAATVLWTSPPTAGATPTPTPVSVVVPTAVPPTPMSAPTPPPTAPPTPRPTPTATRTTEPFTWTGYQIGENGPALYVPAAWPPIDGAALRGYAFFGVSPEAPHPVVLQYHTAITIQRFPIADPAVTADRFADSFQATVLSSTKTVRERADTPAGPAVLLTYQRGTDQQVDAIVARGTFVYMIGMRSPLEKLGENAPIFNEVLRRFAPG